MQGHFPLPLQLADSSIFASSAFHHTSHDILLGIGGRALSIPLPRGGDVFKAYISTVKRFPSTFFLFNLFNLSRDYLPLFSVQFFLAVCFLFLHFKSPSNFPVQSFLLLSCFLFLHLRAFPNSSFDIELWSRLDRDKEVCRKKGIGDCSLFFFFIILFPS